jgi:hypothetical protein
MGKLTRNLKSFSGGLLGLAIMLIALFFILNFVAQRGWGPVSTIAAKVESHANGSAYGSGGGGSVQMAGVPSTSSFGPAL